MSLYGSDHILPILMSIPLISLSSQAPNTKHKPCVWCLEDIRSLIKICWIIDLFSHVTDKEIKTQEQSPQIQDQNPSILTPRYCKDWLGQVLKYLRPKEVGTCINKDTQRFSFKIPLSVCLVYITSLTFSKLTPWNILVIIERKGLQRGKENIDWALPCVRYHAVSSDLLSHLLSDQLPNLGSISPIIIDMETKVQSGWITPPRPQTWDSNRSMTSKVGFSCPTTRGHLNNRMAPSEKKILTLGDARACVCTVAVRQGTWGS